MRAINVTNPFLESLCLSGKCINHCKFFPIFSSGYDFVDYTRRLPWLSLPRPEHPLNMAEQLQIRATSHESFSLQIKQGGGTTQGETPTSSSRHPFVSSWFLKPQWFQCHKGQRFPIEGTLSRSVISLYVKALILLRTKTYLQS